MRDADESVGMVMCAKDGGGMAWEDMQEMGQEGSCLGGRRVSGCAEQVGG